MKKIICSIISTAILLSLSSTVYAGQIKPEDNTNKNVLSVSDIESISKIDSTLCNEPEILQLKKADVLDDFINEVEEQKIIKVKEDINESLERIDNWGLSADTTIEMIKDIAQQYLNTNFNGIQIGSKEFDDMVSLYIETDTMGTDKLADDNPAFAPLYIYMCIYHECFLSDSSTASYVENKSALNNSLILDIIVKDCEANFDSTQARSILGKYLQTYADGPTWPALNGSLIESYARAYAYSYNTGNYITLSADCTNFVSQALFYGYLPKTLISSDKTANGYVETDSRWFYYNNSSASKFSASTSWVRVVELYNYLYPHYAVFETSNGSQMSAYLNRGFVIQGKPLIGSYKHSAIISLVNGQPRFCAHSNNKRDEPMSTFYNNFNKYRVIQTY